MIIFEQKTLGTLVTVTLILITLAQIFYYHPILPERIPVHFDLAMQPDRWAAKNTAFLLHLGITLFFALLFHLMNWIFYKIPDSWINLPHKDYWLAPERKKQTFDALTTFFIWLGNVTMLFVTIVFNLTYQANFAYDQSGHKFWFAFGFFLLTIGYMVFHLFKRFQKSSSN